MQRTVYWLLALGCAALLSCGSTYVALPSPAAIQPAAIQPKLMILPLMLVEEEASRAEVLRQRESLQALGYSVSDSGGAVAWPLSPAAGYFVRSGGGLAVTGQDGTLPELNLGSPSVEIAHPSTPDRRTVVDRARVGDAPVWILPAPFELCMSDEDMCGPGSPVPKLKDILARGVPTKVVRRARGSYPLDQGRDLNCEDENGPLAQHGFQQRELLYLGSTCDGFVRQGACVNEAPPSNLQYDLLLAADLATFGMISNISNLVNGRVLDPYVSGPVNPLTDLSCIDNHAGRVCEMIETSDLSCDAPNQGILVRGIEFASTPMRVPVQAGRSAELVVHNNGLWGYTIAQTVARDTEGTLTPMFRRAAVQRLDAPGVAADFNSGELGENFKLEHSDPQGTRALKYFPDRRFIYTAPIDARPGSTDVYAFEVDFATVEVTFEVVAGPVPTVPPSTEPGDIGGDISPIEVGPLEFQPTHRVGVDPCPQTLGTFTVVNNTPATVDVRLRLGALSNLVIQPGPGTYPLLSGQTMEVTALFNCGTRTSFTNYVEVEFPDAFGNPSPQAVRFQVKVVD